MNRFNMDTRVTVTHTKDFLPLLRTCFEDGLPVSLIVDEGQLCRAEGYIARLDDTSLTLKDGRSFRIATLAAVNGVFIDSYSQC
ncbi:MAG: hypothetical protein IMW88_10385 [Thermoflavifilum sp.]|jgi:hypothetical protein|uniref:hypothetical protein n=1 Tax=Thermoflavifilum sp. TaxID=1968839 RepID=UPI0018A5FCC9|nr:hypothetical protein [Thermoflavifilum sp.]QOR75719.1 MAG: hypothetical protein IMW88_10385 [Thermoflavifilum sp.]